MPGQPGARDAAKGRKSHHLCPWWMGYLLACPLRRLAEKPETILGPLVDPGMTVVDVGCAMGFFSLPLARLVGPSGRVVCLDVQERMLSALRRRARRRGLQRVIETRLCTQDGLGVADLADSVGLVIAIHMLHESTSPVRVLGECHAALHAGGRLLIAEPRGHVSDEAFDATCGLALRSGLVRREAPPLRKSFSALFEKPG